MEKDSDRSINIHISSAAIIKTVVILALFWAVFYMRDLVVVILTAIVIASSIEPLIVWFGKRRVARTISVILIYLFLFILLAGIFYFFVPSLLSDLSDFLTKLPTYLDTVSVWNPFKGNVSPASPVVSNLGLSQGLSISEFINEFNSGFTSASQGFFQTISSLFGGILSLVLIVVLSFYLAVQDDGVAKFLRIVLPIRYEEYVLGLWRRSQQKIGRWLQGQLLLGALMGILVYLGLTILGIKNAILLALLAMVFELIPVFGPILAAIPSTLVAFADGGVAKGFLVIGIYIIMQQFENHLIYPLVVRKIVGIPPILVILAILAGFKLAGVLGILISVPIAAVFVEFLDDLQREKITRKGAAAK